VPRPPRITAAETLYHVWVRATGGGAFFVDSDDRHRLLRILKYTCERHGWLVYAYAQLTTHHHLLVWTPEDDLSRGMQLLSGVYVQSLNRDRGRFGHLVSARFSSKIVETGAYAKELCRYIVVNPVRAGLCDRPEVWPWSSYRATIGLAPVPAYLHTAWVLELFGGDVDEFRLFVDAALELGTDPGSDPASHWARA
jgi:REP element-mobilizing transposase RayT